VQRRRDDIEDYAEDTPFPKREDAEARHTLNPAYRDLFDQALVYARETRSIRADFGGFRTPVSVQSVHPFRGFRTPRREEPRVALA
jgi:hypothetical protein